MELVRLYLFPLGLSLVGCILIHLELAHYARERRRRRASLMRLLRRLTGALIMIVIAVLVHVGKIAPGPVQSPEEARALLNHWLWVMGLVVVAMILAVWDVLDGVRNLRRYFEDMEQEEVSRIREHLTTPAREVDLN